MKIVLTICSLVLFTSTLPAQDYYADYLSVGGGYYFAPNGSTSPSVDIGYFALNDGTIMGGELHMKSISTPVFGVEGVGLTTVTLSSLYGYMFVQNDMRPYFGGGFTVGFNGLNSDDVTRKRPELVVNNNMAKSFGLFGFAGVQFVASKRISLFADARYGVEYFYAFIENVSDEYINIGGMYGRVGLRITLHSSEDL